MTNDQTMPMVAIPTEICGYLSYEPNVEIDLDTKLDLSDILLAQGLIQESENKSIVCDWIAYGAGYRCQSKIILYMDGGDGEDPAFIFYRENFKGCLATDTLVHIPTNIIQEEFQVCWQWYKDPSGARYNVIHSYLAKIINDLSSWSSITHLPEED